MKVAMVTPYWYPVKGGPTTYVAQLADELRIRYGADVYVIAREGHPQGARIVGGSPRRFVLKAAKELENVLPDAVHAHGHWYALAAALRYRKARPAAKVVFTVHTEFRGLTRLRTFLLRRLLSRADTVTAVSADLLGRLLSTVRPRARTRITRPGVVVRPATEYAVDRLLARLGSERGEPLVAFVGPMAYEEKSRGVAQLIRAMRVVRERHPDARLIVAGDGPQRKGLEELASREIPAGACFLGTIDDPETLYAVAHLVAHISFQEGLPVAILEAMATGTPVLATRTGGIPEVIRDGENGFLVDGEVGAIAARIVSLLDSEEVRVRVSARAKADVADRFSWAAAARRFAQLYGEPTTHLVAVTVDLERDYAVSPERFRGIEEALPKLLALFEANGIRATFFATGDLCDRYADRLLEIVRRGHFLGCHGETHDSPYLARRPFEWQLASIRRATEALERTTGVRPVAFRAPNFSADASTIAALEKLGYWYDSSVLPGRVVRLQGLFPVIDFLSAPRDPYRPSRVELGIPGDSPLIEVPVAENPFVPGGPIGAGYVNANGAERAADAVSRCAADACVLLIHPWELVEPPHANAPPWMRTACSPDLSRMGAFLKMLGSTHHFTTVEDLCSDAFPQRETGGLGAGRSSREDGEEINSGLTVHPNPGYT